MHSAYWVELDRLPKEVLKLSQKYMNTEWHQLLSINGEVWWQSLTTPGFQRLKKQQRNVVKNDDIPQSSQSHTEHNYRRWNTLQKTEVNHTTVWRATDCKSYTWVTVQLTTWTSGPQIIIEDWIPYKRLRLIKPQFESQETLSVLLMGHCATDNMHLRATETVYCQAIENWDYIRQCMTCAVSMRLQQRDTVKCTDAPHNPWVNAGLDIFQLKGIHSLLMVDGRLLQPVPNTCKTQLSFIQDCNPSLETNLHRSLHLR